MKWAVPCFKDDAISGYILSRVLRAELQGESGKINHVSGD